MEWLFIISICIISITFLITIKTIAIKVGIQFNCDEVARWWILLLQYPICQEWLKVSCRSFLSCSSKQTPIISQTKDIQGRLIFTVLSTIIYLISSLIVATFLHGRLQIIGLLNLGLFFRVLNLLHQRSVTSTFSSLAVHPTQRCLYHLDDPVCFSKMKVSALCSDEDQTESVCFCSHQRRWS